MACRTFAMVLTLLVILSSVLAERPEDEKEEADKALVVERPAGKVLHSERAMDEYHHADQALSAERRNDYVLEHMADKEQDATIVNESISNPAAVQQTVSLLNHAGIQQFIGGLRQQKNLWGTTSWDKCMKSVYTLWDGYASSHYERGSFVWILAEDVEDDFKEPKAATWLHDLVQRLARTFNEDAGKTMYLGRIISWSRFDQSQFTAELLDEDYRPLGKRFTAHVSYIAESADSLALLTQAIVAMPCVAQQVQWFKDRASHWAQHVKQTAGQLLKNAFRSFQDNGALTLSFTAGLSWRGRSLLEALHSNPLAHSARTEVSIGIVIFPPNVAGTVVGEFCSGKDSNRFSIDFAANLEIGFDNSCFSGQAAGISLAAQLPNNFEVGVSAAMTLPQPALEALAVSFGYGLSNGVPSSWNPFSNAIAGTAVVCKSIELISRNTHC
eukprot:TRINITY_DN16545_c0_g1_i1.p1 TRINITY_DN16545_c0_g1~~TRINITY_DN16545_c0_g1_i1.p1  ORF type:complete len:442 (+),score=68.05 TRINITY_DN16545_c0_g1_i1:117-1442(+)